jgi:mannose-1-phosphate guanylyltransferase / mannose-6-phosphate isomerase
LKGIILAGGSGSRLWPLSKTHLPKQFLHFGNGETLLQKTIKRYLLLCNPSDLFLVTSQDYFPLVKIQAESIHPILATQILVEPEKKGTAPAIAFAVSYFLNVLCCDLQECFFVSSSDHLISPMEPFLVAMRDAEAIAAKGRHVLFGIYPQRPETGYGYIKANARGEVEQFIEKPQLERAQEFLLSGEYLWNSGIFVFQLFTFLEELEEYAPQLAAYVRSSLSQNAQAFSELQESSIDCALMERSRKTHVLPLAISWYDVGSWDGVYDVLEKDENDNVKVGNIFDVDTKNCLILGGKRLISTIGLENLFVIETEDAILIGKRGEAQRVKSLVEALKRREETPSFSGENKEAHHAR